MINFKRLFHIMLLYSTTLFILHTSAAIGADPILGIEDIASSLNPVGSGARAMGMGGAFIAVADDATAASWNPGGLIQIEKPEISIVFSSVKRKTDNSFSKYEASLEYLQGIAGDQTIYDDNINYLSIAYPFILYKNMIISLNYQHIYDFNREWRYNQQYENSHYRQIGSIYSLGLSYNIQISEFFSIGITDNYWGYPFIKNKWKSEYYLDFFNIKRIDEYSFNGQNFNIGFLWRLSERWRIGGVYKTSFIADIEHKWLDIPKKEKSETIKIKMPESYGIGIACHLSDQFIITGDIYRTQWNNLRTEITSLNATATIPDNKTFISPESTTCFRLGIEYLTLRSDRIIPIRTGIFYDPAPSKQSVSKFYGFTCGSGITLKTFSFDIAYQFRSGRDSNTLSDSLLQNIKEHIVYASLIYYLKF